MTTSDKRAGSVGHGHPSNPRGEGNTPRELSQEVLRNLLHPKEPARAMLVWVSAGLTGLVLLLIAVSLSTFLVIVAGVGVVMQC